MTKKKILFLLKFPFYGGGSGTFTRRLAQKLTETGRFDVAVASPDKREIPGVKIYTIKPAFKAVFESHPEWPRAEKYSELTGEEFTRQYQSFLKQIVEIVEDFRPDVIHVNHAHFLTWIASFIKSMLGIGFVVTVHGTDIYNATLDRRYLVLTGQSVNRAEQIIAVSPHTKKWFLKVFGQKNKYKTRIIAHGIDTDLYEKEAADINFIDKKYHTKDKKIVMFVGRLTREKGLEYLIKAARKIKGEIFIIGDGAYKDYLVNYTELHTTKNVHFLGYFGKNNINELRGFFHRANVLVLPSVVNESLGFVVLEAMACKTPVVASNKGGIPLVVKNNHNGILVRARSAKALGMAINKLLKNEILAQKMGESAYKTIAEKFDWNVIVPQYESVYNKATEVTKKLLANKTKSILDKEELAREKKELTEKIDIRL
jgi:glycosyltransferase involved in cell wall biosynthesis